MATFREFYYALLCGVWIAMLICLTSCAPQPDLPPTEVKATNPQSIGGMLPIGLIQDSLSNSAFSFGFTYDNLERVVQFSVRMQHNNLTEGQMAIGYVLESFKPSQIRITGMPASIWPLGDGVFTYNYNQVGRIERLVFEPINPLQPQPSRSTALYYYADNKLIRSMVTKFGNPTDSTEIKSWDKDQPTSADFIRKLPNRSQTAFRVDYRYNQDSLLQTKLVTSSSRNAPFSSVSFIPSVNTAANLKAHQLNPLWVLIYLRQLQDMTLPPPMFTAKLAAFNRVQEAGINCSAALSPQWTGTFSNLGSDTIGDGQFSPPSRIKYQIETYCNRTVLQNQGQRMEYIKAK